MHSAAFLLKLPVMPGRTELPPGPLASLFERASPRPVCLACLAGRAGTTQRGFLTSQLTLLYHSNAHKYYGVRTLTNFERSQISTLKKSPVFFSNISTYENYVIFSSFHFSKNDNFLTKIFKIFPGRQTHDPHISMLYIIQHRLGRPRALQIYYICI